MEQTEKIKGWHKWYYENGGTIGSTYLKITEDDKKEYLWVRENDYEICGFLSFLEERVDDEGTIWYKVDETKKSIPRDPNEVFVDDLPF